MTALEKYFQDKNIPQSEKEEAATEFMGVPDIIKKKSPGFLMRLLDILDRPGNAARALLVGKLGGLKGLIPFAQFIEDVTGIDVFLNEDEMVRGTEVIETWFGKQKQRKGKIDTVDIMGFIVEVIADPLWLVGGPALTKAGRAAKIIKGAATRGDAAVVRAAFKMARTGTPVTGKANKVLVKAFKSLMRDGKIPVGTFKAAGWADEVSKGHRALLKLGFPGQRKTVIKGKTVWGQLDKWGTKIRKGYIGVKLLAPTKRVSTKFKDELHEIATHFSRDLSGYEKRQAFVKLEKLYNRAKKAGINEGDLTKYVEAVYSGESIDSLVRQIKVKRAKIAKPRLVKARGQLKRLRERAEKAEVRIKATGVIPERVKPALKEVPIRGTTRKVSEITGFKVKPVIEVRKPVVAAVGLKRKMQPLYNKIAKLKDKIDDLKATGTPKANSEIRKLTKKLDSLEEKIYIDAIKATNRAELKAYTNAIRMDKLKVSKRIALAKKDLKFIDNEIAKTQKAIQRFQKFPQKNIKALRDLQAKRIQLADEAVELIENVPEKARGEFQVLAKTYKEYGKEMLISEQKLGVRVSAVQAPFGYMRRKATPEFLDWLDKHPRYGTRAQFSLYDPSQTRRRTAIATMTRDEVNAFYAAKGFKGDVFEPSTAKAMLTRATGSAKVKGSARTIKESIRKFSATNIPVDEDWVPVNRLYELKGMKKPVGLLDEPQRFLPRDVFNALTETHGIALKDDFTKAVTKINRFYKGAFTIYWPAYHGRNAISNIFLNWIGGVQNPASYTKAFQLQKAAHKTRKLMKTGLSWDDAAKKVNWPTVGNTPGHTFYNMSDQAGLLNQSVGEFGIEEVTTRGLEKAKTLLGRLGQHDTPVGRAGFITGQSIENNARLAHAIEKFEKGMDLRSAAVSAKKVLFDYGDLSEFEKGFMRDKAFLFYTFARKNLPLQVQTLIQQPAKQALFAHAMGGTPRMQKEAPYWRDYEQEKLMLPTPIYTDEGERYVIRGTGMPIEEAFGPISAPGFGLMDRASRFMSRAMARTTPIPKAVTELATKRNLYFDKPIRSWGRWLEQQSPFSRASGSVRQLYNPYEPTASKVSGFMTGVRFRPETEEQREWAIREAINEYLSQKKGIKQYRRFYTKEEDEELKALIKLQER